MRPKTKNCIICGISKVNMPPSHCWDGNNSSSLNIYLMLIFLSLFFGRLIISAIQPTMAVRFVYNLLFYRERISLANGKMAGESIATFTWHLALAWLRTKTILNVARHLWSKTKRYHGKKLKKNLLLPHRLIRLKKKLDSTKRTNIRNLFPSISIAFAFTFQHKKWSVWVILSSVACVKVIKIRETKKQCSIMQNISRLLCVHFSNLSVLMCDGWIWKQGWKKYLKFKTHEELKKC